MGSEKWKEYAEELTPYKYEIAAGILFAFALFYVIWIAYLLYKACKVRNKGWNLESEYDLSAETSKYILTTIGLCFQFMVVGSYIAGKVVKTVLVDRGVLNVSTCDSEHQFKTPTLHVASYYYIETMFQVFAMLSASCMLTSFNVLLNYLKQTYLKTSDGNRSISVGMKRLILELVIILFISIIGVGIPIAIVVLFVCIVYKFVRLILNCKNGYRVYRFRLQEMSDRNPPGDSRSEEIVTRFNDLKAESIQYGYITTVFSFGGGFYIAQLALDPLTSMVEASCTLFPEDREYITILFHFMNLLIWGSFALVAILYLPFYIPYTFYYIGLVFCPDPVLKFLKSAINCFRKPMPKLSSELNEPLLPNNNTKVQQA